MSATVLTLSAQQAWPPFALVAGLVLIGLAAAEDGLFEALGSRIARVRRGELFVFSALMAIVALVSVTLNLDTSVVFLTPVLLHVARQRAAPVTAYLYGAVFMSNAGSLLLPGSNLTNLLVLAGPHQRGTDFAAVMLAPWLSSVVVTWAVLALWRRRDWTQGQASDEPLRPLRLGPGLLGVVGAVGLTLALSRPALPVLGLGLAVSVVSISRGHVTWRRALRSLSPRTLGPVFVLTVALGALARLGDAPVRVLNAVGPWGGAALAGALSSVINNLPATMILSAHAPAHPYAILLGLDLGPNASVIGALSGLLWLRIARESGVRPSPRTYTMVGAVLVPVSLAAALLALALVTPGSF